MFRRSVKGRSEKELSKLSRKSLEHNAQVSWKQLKPTILQNLVNTMPRIVKGVLKTKGSFFDERKIDNCKSVKRQFYVFFNFFFYE